jgi:hypothetical protein
MFTDLSYADPNLTAHVPVSWRQRGVCFLQKMQRWGQLKKNSISGVGNAQVCSLREAIPASVITLKIRF